KSIPKNQLGKNTNQEITISPRRRREACPQIPQLLSQDNWSHGLDRARYSNKRRVVIARGDSAAGSEWTAALGDRKVAAAPRALASSASEYECRPSVQQACSPVRAED